MIELEVLNKLSQIHVLLVEDNEEAALLIKESLSFHCKQVDIAYDGMSGFESFEKNKPDIIIADINLPKMNGLEMVAAIHDVLPNLPVIIITSHDNSKNISESINQGVYGYLRKPIRIEELQTALLIATKNICNSQVTLKENFIYDIGEKELKNCNNIIPLTKSEKKLLYLLISNINKTMSFMTIESYVWQEKSMSAIALRMCIKKIRKKTYPELIENIPGCGYRINSIS